MVEGGQNMSESAMCDFRPQYHAFRFANDFGDCNFELPGGINYRVKGLCIGMAYGVLDYYFSGINIPSHIASDFENGKAPREGSALYNFIRDRNDDCMRYASTIKGITQILAGEPREFYVRLAYDVELPKIKKRIRDEGKPVPIILTTGLENGFDPLHPWQSTPPSSGGHGMVVYGYGQDGDNVTLYVYDCNHPKEDGSRVWFTRSGKTIEDDSGRQWQGFFVSEYGLVEPPYRDMTIVQGLTTNTDEVYLRDPLTCSFKVKNVGEYQAHYRTFASTLKDPIGNSFTDYLVGGDATLDLELAPNQESEEMFTAYHFDKPAGTYTLAAQYLSVGRTFTSWINLSSQGEGASATKTIVARGKPITEQKLLRVEGNLDFGEVGYDDTVEKTVTLVCYGYNPVNVYSIDQPTVPQFRVKSVVPGLWRELNPGDQVVATFTCHADVGNQLLRDSVRVNTDSNDLYDLRLNLRARTKAPYRSYVLPSFIWFGEVVDDGPQLEETFYLVNNGSLQLFVRSIVLLDETDRFTYEVPSAVNLVVPHGESLQIKARFTPPKTQTIERRDPSGRTMIGRTLHYGCEAYKAKLVFSFADGLPAQDVILYAGQTLGITRPDLSDRATYRNDVLIAIQRLQDRFETDTDPVARDHIRAEIRDLMRLIGIHKDS